MSLILPRDIELIAERRASETGFRTTADYVAHLVAADARAAADDALESALLEGLEGNGEEWDPEAVRSACRDSLAAARKTS